MSEEQNSFIIGATQLAEEQLATLAETTDAQTAEEVRTRVSLILRDIRRSVQGSEQGTAPADEETLAATATCCSQCLPNYDACIASGKTKTYCQSQYNTCLSTCNTGC